MKYNNNISNQLFAILSPLLGESFSASAIQLQSGKAGKTPETLTEKELPQIAEAVKRSLTIFTGIDAAQKIADKINMLKQ